MGNPFWGECQRAILGDPEQNALPLCCHWNRTSQRSIVWLVLSSSKFVREISTIGLGVLRLAKARRTSAFASSALGREPRPRE